MEWILLTKIHFEINCNKIESDKIYLHIEIIIMMMIMMIKIMMIIMMIMIIMIIMIFYMMMIIMIFYMMMIIMIFYTIDTFNISHIDLANTSPIPPLINSE